MQRVMRNLNKGELRLAFVEANLLSVSCAIVLQLYNVPCISVNWYNEPCISVIWNDYDADQDDDHYDFMIFKKIWINPNISILKVMTDWLAPMPDKGLPHVNMRSKSNNKALHGCISSCKGLFPYYVSQNQGSWTLPPPSVSNGQHLHYPPTPLVSNGQDLAYPPSLSPRQLLSAFARHPFCTTIFYEDLFTW